DWAKSVLASDTSVIYMGAGQAAAIAAALIAGGKPASLPIAVVENASLPESRVFYTTLGALHQIEHRKLEGPAVMLLGEQFRASASPTVATIEYERFAAKG